MNGRALVFEGPGRLSVVDREPQPLGATEVRIRTNSAGICGSDVHGFTGANQRRVPGMVMGHEAVGVVVERGSDVTDPAVGDRVVLNPAVTCGECEFCLGGADHRCPSRRLYGCVSELPGAFADSFVVNAVNAVPFEGPAPLEWGALVEPFAVGGHGAGLLGGPLEHGVLVIGAGPIGVGAALGARRRGIDRVVVSETNAHRRAVAETLGLRTFDPASSLALEPFDGAVECVAAPATLRDALTLTRPGGEIVVVGLGATEMEFSVQQLVVGERVMRGSFNYSRAEFAAVARWVSSGEVDLTPVIEARVDIEGLIEAFHGYAAGSSDALKTVFQPGLTPDGTRS
ncbi:MAG TPA: alcohol dehydrogenase catalytic domain-containing protein [Solirubrobacteraceae bacterium]|nr:alcohol dehydrogenase catalytic domain-containing protein [Solirubrobacteraceae bacterium]